MPLVCQLMIFWINLCTNEVLSHPLRDSGSSSRTQERIEDNVTGVGCGIDEFLDKLFGIQCWMMHIPHIENPRIYYISLCRISTHSNNGKTLTCQVCLTTSFIVSIRQRMNPFDFHPEWGNLADSNLFDHFLELSECKFLLCVGQIRSLHYFKITMVNLGCPTIYLPFCYFRWTWNVQDGNCISLTSQSEKTVPSH